MNTIQKGSKNYLVERLSLISPGILSKEEDYLGIRLNLLHSKLGVPEERAMCFLKSYGKKFVLK